MEKDKKRINVLVKEVLVMNQTLLDLDFIKASCSQISDHIEQTII